MLTELRSVKQYPKTKTALWWQVFSVWFHRLERSVISRDSHFQSEPVQHALYKLQRFVVDGDEQVLPLICLGID